MALGWQSAYRKWGRFPNAVAGAGGGAGGGGGLPAWIAGATIRADGFSLDAVSTPPGVGDDGILEFDLPVTRAGYNSAGNATTYSDTLTYVSRRMREPGLTSLAALRCALSEGVTAADVVPGLTNNSTETMPGVAANWVTMDRDVVGNTGVPIEVQAMHYSGVPVLVRFTATDGTNTVTFDATAPVAVKKARDAFHLNVFRWPAPDFSSLNNGIITVNARCFPKWGTAASITDSATLGHLWWEFAPRYFIKDPTRAGSLVRCYVDPVAGNNTTGTWSTDDATARAAPFQTTAGAYGTRRSTIPAGAFLASGNPDGCECRLLAGTHTLTGTTANVPSIGGACIITRDPLASKASVIVNPPAGNFTLRQTGSIAAPIPSACLRFGGCTYVRTANFGFSGFSTPIAVQFVDELDFDNNGQAGVIFVAGAAIAIGFLDGTAITNLGTSTLSTNMGLARGVSAPMGNRAFTCLNMAGCSFQDPGSITRPPQFTTDSIPFRNFCYQGNFLWGKVTLGQVWGHGGNANIDVGARWNNVFEVSGTAPQAVHQVSADSGTGSVTGFYCFHETFAGLGLIGRHNHLYVDTDATAGRVHKWVRFKANIIESLNTKHDLFGTPNAIRIGGWWVCFGTGHDHNWQRFPEGFATSRINYAGRGSFTGPETGADPLFVAPANVTAGPTPGTGNGNYRLQAGSPCKGRNIGEILVPFDADGTARGTTTSAGAFV